MSAHTYVVGLTWEGNRGEGTRRYAGYGRGFRVAVAGKPDLLGTADPAFHGEPGRHNPEELLVAALASCHMLFYLSLCARHGIAVVRYADEAEGTLAVDPAGGGRFQEVVLRPRVAVALGTDPGPAAALHARAAELCFIARSCSFPVRHEPVVDVETGVQGRR